MSEPTEEQCVAVAVELENFPQPIILEFKPLDAFYLVGMMQLALTHPHLPEGSRQYASGMVSTLRTLFEATGCSQVVDFIDRGDRW